MKLKLYIGPYKVQWKTFDTAEGEGRVATLAPALNIQNSFNFLAPPGPPSVFASKSASKRCYTLFPGWAEVGGSHINAQQAAIKTSI